MQGPLVQTAAGLDQDQQRKINHIKLIERLTGRLKKDKN